MNRLFVKYKNKKDLLEVRILEREGRKFLVEPQNHIIRKAYGAWWVDFNKVIRVTQ